MPHRPPRSAPATGHERYVHQGRRDPFELTARVLRQAAQAMPRLAKLCNLTETEQSWLLNARPGEGLLLAQGKRVPFFLPASEEEARLIKQGESRSRTA